MMQDYENHHIQELPLSAPFFRNKVVRFLGENGLRLEAVDAYYVIQNTDGDILAGAGLCADLVKCVAVSAAARQEGLLAPLMSHLIAEAAAKGHPCLKLFTKPEYRALFESLGFRLLASAPKAILMENGRGLEQYCAYLRSQALPGRSGVIVMNANPFTLGHQYLIYRALEQVDTLYIIPVREDLSRFSYAERLAMIRAASVRPTAEFSPALATPTHADAAGIDPGSRVVVLEGSAYQISAATFPTYFLKDLSEVAETQMRLDIDLFARWIAPALGGPVRFVGSEPTDVLTARYNALLHECLPQVVEIPRLESASHAISASAVRAALDAGSLDAAAELCPETTWPYLLADLAERALRMELEMPLKPGLVGPDSQGAHKDMDYALMRRGIAAIRPFYAKMAMARDEEALRQLGIEAEKAMMAATGGVNTHRGAIFCLGLAVYAWTQGAHNEELMHSSLGKIAGGIYSKSQSVNNLPPRAAMANALGGYQKLFEDWLPYYRQACRQEGQLLLLRIMSTLEDTCVVKRVGPERAQQVKEEARALFQDPNGAHLEEMCNRYAAEGISPGGAADMLALTIFIDSILS